MTGGRPLLQLQQRSSFICSHCSKLQLLQLSILLLLPLAVTPAEFFLDRLGELGRNYNLNQGKPYISCKSYENEWDVNTVRCGPTDSEFWSKRLGCNALLKVHDPAQYMVQETDELELDASQYDRYRGGCWHGSSTVHEQCNNEETCVAEIRKENDWTGIAFCCCTTHDCNAQDKITVKFVRNDTEFNFTTLISTTDRPPSSDPAIKALWILLWVSIGVLFLVAALLVACRMRRAKPWLKWLFGERKQVFDSKRGDDVPLVTMENGRPRENLKEGLALMEVLAVGKLSTVRRAQLVDADTGKAREVAVKTIGELKGFLVEEAVFRVCANAHPHLLHFIGSNYEPEVPLYYVVSEYHAHGCLEEYLKEHIFTPLEAVTFLASLMDGLAFLHAASSNLPDGGFKCPIVHRDIKSRNVLVKADGTAALADFGLAMICEGNRTHGRHYQVGTHRYMSPELLAGMANLNMDGLKMADVYAASLIIWETLNRTQIDEEDEIGPAELPYTKEVEVKAETEETEWRRRHPDPKDVFAKKPISLILKAIVHTDNKRPQMRERLKSNQITAELLRTTLDMWDFEVDGRISAACAHARLELLKKNAIAGTIPSPDLSH